MAELFYIPIDNKIDKHMFGYLCRFVEQDKQTRIKQFTSDIDRKLSLYADLFIRMIICQKFGITNDEIIFGKGAYGKPFVVNFPNFHYNLSHTRNAIAVAISCNEIGIDIEKINNNHKEIAARFFTEDEYQYIYCTKAYQDRRFYEIWTMKEAYIKCIGKGLSMQLNSFTVLNSNSDLKCSSSFKDDYVVSFCEKKNDHSNFVIEITEKEIINKYCEVF